MRAAKLLVALCICVAVVSAAYAEEKKWAREEQVLSVLGVLV